MTKTTWQQSRAGRVFLRLYGHRKRVKITHLARARLLLGLSAAQAAKRAGILPCTWVQWEIVGERRREPNPEAAAKILWLFNPSNLYIVHLRTDPYITVNPKTLDPV